MDPTTLVFAGFLTAILGVIVLHDADGPDAADEPTPSNTPSEGDDVITEVSFEDEETPTLETLGGDDLVQLDDFGPATVDYDDRWLIDLGDGDDTFAGGLSGYVHLLGGEGNDDLTITEFDEAYVLAGAGDDIVTFASARPVDGFNAGYLDLGDGNDTVNFDMASGQVNGNVEGIWLEGGEGADVYQFTLLPDEGALNSEVYEDDTAVATLTDFEAGVDRLIVDPTSLAGDFTYVGHEWVTNPADGHTSIMFNYTHPDHPNGASLGISYTDADFSFYGHVEIINVPAPIAATA